MDGLAFGCICFSSEFHLVTTAVDIHHASEIVFPVVAVLVATVYICIFRLLLIQGQLRDSLPWGWGGVAHYDL